MDWRRSSEFIHFLEDAPPVATDNFGLYMLIEESDTKRDLLYIGLVKSERRSLYIRVNEHRRDWLWDVERGLVHVKIGTVQVISRPHVADRQMIEDIESALIFGAQPRENSKKKHSYTLFEDLVVDNAHHGGYLRDSYSTKMQSGRGFR